MLAKEYNVIGEYVGLTVALILLFLMSYSKPKKTSTYIIVHLGVMLSILTTILNIVLHTWAYHAALYSRSLFASLAMIFVLCYLLILLLLYNYIYSVVNKQRKKITHNYWWALLSVFPFIVIANIMIKNGLFFTYSEAGVRFSWFSYYYLTIGILDAVICMITVFIHKKYMPKTFFKFFCILIPADAVLLVFQMLSTDTSFTSLTYVIPFMLFYILFHSIPYNEYTGCQNADSFEARFQDNLSMKKKFAVAYIRIPQMEHVDFSKRSKKIDILFASVCREIEEVSRGIYIYRLENSKFAFFINQKNRMVSNEIVHRIREIMEDNESKLDNVLACQLIVFEDHRLIDDTAMLDSMQEYLFKKLDRMENENFYYAKEEDYEQVSRSHVIEQALLNIRNNKDLDDERVVCFAQPIFCVKDQSFQTAESLMRLRIDGQLIFPDQFIQLAEENNCIHVLTCIMLNKVCKEIKKLQDDYIFDGITINCSSIEFSDPHLHEELLQIIKDNGVDPKLLRIELTESAVFADMRAVLENMMKLKDAGICFYLDDFGTGYSNMERIVNYPFQTIKFDKSLLYKAIEDEKIEELLSHMVMIFKKIGFHILVEGVEDKEQTEYSIDHGFEFLQGYHYSKPKPIEELEEFFQKK